MTLKCVMHFVEIRSCAHEGELVFKLLEPVQPKPNAVLQTLLTSQYLPQFSPY
jgi:hypothetical protein